MTNLSLNNVQTRLRPGSPLYPFSYEHVFFRIQVWLAVEEGIEVVVAVVGGIWSAQGIAASLGGGVWASIVMLPAGVWARGVLERSGTPKLSQSMTAIEGSQESVEVMLDKNDRIKQIIRGYNLRSTCQ